MRCSDILHRKQQVFKNVLTWRKSATMRWSTLTLLSSEGKEGGGGRGKERKRKKEREVFKAKVGTDREFIFP